MIKKLLWMSLVACPAWASAKTIFESYYRVESDRKHVGYVLQRLEQDPQTKVQTLKGYVQLDQDGKTIWQEVALTHREGHAFRSIYKSNESGDLQSVTAVFDRNGAGKVILQSGKGKPRANRISSVDVLSGLLFYSVDLSLLKKDIAYSYKAFSEERGRVARGSIILMSKESAGERQVLQLADEFIGQTIENFVNTEGIPLGSRIDSLKLVTYWVPDRAAAIGVMEFPEARIKKIFGAVPKGQTSPWSKVPDARADVIIDKFSRPPFDRPVQPSRASSLPMRKS